VATGRQKEKDTLPVGKKGGIGHCLNKEKGTVPRRSLGGGPRKEKKKNYNQKETVNQENKSGFPFPRKLRRLGPKEKGRKGSRLGRGEKKEGGVVGRAKKKGISSLSIRNEMGGRQEEKKTMGGEQPSEWKGK